jgi:hypothetical protein
MKSNKTRLSILKKKKFIIWMRLLIFGKKLIASSILVLIGLISLSVLIPLWFLGLFLFILFNFIFLLYRSLLLFLK